MTISRRRFVKQVAWGAAGMALAQTTQPLVGAGRSATDQVLLGKTGIRASRIAMGTGFNGGGRSSAQVRQGREAFTRLMRNGLDQGMNFFDMADLYGSHQFVGEVVREVGRDKVVLLSKIWFAQSAGMEGADRAIPEVDRFRRELGTDMLDICLIHCVTNSEWPSQLERMRDELSELKEKGAIRATGVSCHDFGALEVAADHPWVDVIFARINPGAKVMDHSDPQKVADILRRARANGKAVVGMKIYGAGQLSQPEQREESMRWVWGNQLIDAMTIGFEEPEQMDDTVTRLNRVFQA